MSKSNKAENADQAAVRELAAVKALVEAHSKLEDKPTGAIMLPKKRFGVSVLEVIPTMPADTSVDEPMEFLPSADFRFGLRLYTGKEKDFLEAVDRNPTFAADVAAGIPIPRANSVTNKLKERAAKALKNRSK
jgi:hypothetical protein